MPSSPESIAEWTRTVQQELPHLSVPQAKVLALWSWGAQALQSCGQSQVAFFLAQVLGQSSPTVRQRLREWTWERAAKAGPQRQDLPVAACFGPLLAWVLRAWPAHEQRLALALDATSLGERFVVLAVSVLYQGCAIPVAWQVLPANVPGAWRPHWERLLAQLQPSLPAGWFVLVLADRGLFAHWLFRALVRCGWHPCLRINTAGKCQVAGESDFRWLLSLVPAAGGCWQGRVRCFKKWPLRATLVIYHDPAYQAPWLWLTDLDPEAVCQAWYGLRAWIEASFKDSKTGGWQWQRTRMTDPGRAARLWLVLAVSLLYAISLGSQTEALTPSPHLAELPPTHIARQRATARPAPRKLSLTTQGHLTFLAQLVSGRRPATQLQLVLPSGLLPGPQKTYP